MCTAQGALEKADKGLKALEEQTAVASAEKLPATTSAWCGECLPDDVLNNRVLIVCGFSCSPRCYILGVDNIVIFLRDRSFPPFSSTQAQWAIC